MNVSNANSIRMESVPNILDGRTPKNLVKTTSAYLSTAYSKIWMIEENHTPTIDM